ncbi:MAG TPA: RodZ domain-containing protein [Geminicoccaceae bacterium]|nr:RodZ domain-containing protein [Geminicoccaceae bacterium]
MTHDHDRLDPAEALMREVGAQLRRVRLERGEELDDVAKQLRIKPTYLLGIEQGDLSMLPGRAYALGFLRSYAGYLGFDGDDLIVRIKSTVANLTDRTRLRIRTPLPESRLPKMPIVVLSLAAVAAVYASWSYADRSGQMAIETVGEVPPSLRGLALDALRDDAAPRPSADDAAMQPEAGPGGSARADAATRPDLAPGASGAPLTEPGAPAASQAAGPGSPTAQELLDRAARLRFEPGPTDAEVAGTAGPAEPGQVAARAFDPTAIPALGQIFEPANTDARVVLRALGSSWIQVSSRGGDYLRALILQRGDVFLVPNRPDLELWTGNAGGLEILVDGTVLAPLGGAGAVVRDVPLDPPSLQARFGRLIPG